MSRMHKMPKFTHMSINIYICVYIICIYCIHGYTFLEKHTHRDRFDPTFQFLFGFCEFPETSKTQPNIF